MMPSSIIQSTSPHFHVPHWGENTIVKGVVRDRPANTGYRAEIAALEQHTLVANHHLVPRPPLPE